MSRELGVGLVPNTCIGGSASGWLGNVWLLALVSPAACGGTEPPLLTSAWLTIVCKIVRSFSSTTSEGAVLR
mgnify:CR=1 FL=1